MFRRVFLALAFCASVARADVALELKGDVSVVKVDKVVVIQEDRTLVKSVPFKIVAPAKAHDYRWTVPDGVKYNDLGDSIEVTAAPKGELTIRVRIQLIDFKNESVTYTTGVATFNYGGTVTPPAPPPNPVDPPKPPDIKPPITGEGLRVLVVAESTAGALHLTQKQTNELYGQAMADYSRAKFAKGSDGTPEFRRFDKDIDTSRLNATWKEAFAEWQTNAKGVVPWIVISNGVTGFSGPLPDGGILELIRRYER